VWMKQRASARSPDARCRPVIPGAEKDETLHAWRWQSIKGGGTDGDFAGLGGWRPCCGSGGITVILRDWLDDGDVVLAAQEHAMQALCAAWRQVEQWVHREVEVSVAVLVWARSSMYTQVA